MSIELLEMSPTEFFNFINKFPDLGDITVLDHSEASGSLDDLQPDDLVVYYDFCTDDLDNTDEFNYWINNSLELITDYMTDIGYEMAAELDGSGGGLHYGVLQFRKAYSDKF